MILASAPSLPLQTELKLHARDRAELVLKTREASYPEAANRSRTTL